MKADDLRPWYRSVFPGNRRLFLRDIVPLARMSGVDVAWLTEDGVPIPLDLLSIEFFDPTDPRVQPVGVSADLFVLGQSGVGLLGLDLKGRVIVADDRAGLVNPVAINSSVSALLVCLAALRESCLAPPEVSDAKRVHTMLERMRLIEEEAFLTSDSNWGAVLEEVGGGILLVVGYEAEPQPGRRGEAGGTPTR